MERFAAFFAHNSTMLRLNQLAVCLDCSVPNVALIPYIFIPLLHLNRPDFCRTLQKVH